MKMKGIAPTICMLLFILFLPDKASASFITIETTTTASATGDNATVRVNVSNRGDEAARNVGISASFASEHFKGKLRDTLSPGGRYSEEFTSPAGFKENGRYPVIVTVTYTDANLYPFSSLSVSYLNYGDPVECTVTGSIPELGLADEGYLDAAVKNVGKDTKKISYDLESPMELAIEVPKGEITVGPQSEKKLETRIRNLSALPDSRYRVFAVLQYEGVNGHCSTVIPGDTVIGNKSPLKRFRGYLIGLVCVLAALTAFYNLRRHAKHGRKG